MDRWSRLLAVSAVLLVVSAAGVVIDIGVAGAQPTARILSPPSGFKLRQGQSAAVAIEVDGGAGLSWTLSLRGPGYALSTLASGTGAMVDATVAAIDPATLSAGEMYELTLVAADSVSTTAAEASFSIPDPQYVIIPLHAGNLSRLGLSTWGVDAAGRQVMWPPSDGDPPPITVLNLATGQHQTMRLPISNNVGVTFSGDGTRLYFEGLFRVDGIDNIGIGFVDIASQALQLDVTDTTPFFSVDRSGNHVAYQVGLPDDSLQYALYTQDSGAIQLTTSPDTIAFSGSDCLAQYGTRPFISPDGGRVVFITPSTLGISPPDPAVGCRVYAYDVSTQAFTQLVALPSSLYSIDIPALSDDGRWLSFPVIQMTPVGSRGVPALVDLESGVLSLPVVDVGNFTSFDAAITGNAAGIVISTEADLDPRVGNADHNLELFYYDRATGQSFQITETTAGVGTTPNGCGSYRPSVSGDGSVIVFAFSRISTDGCYIDGPQRSEVDGFNFAFVRAVRKRPGNRSVVLDAVPDQHVVAGKTLTITLTAHDPDGDPINFFAQTKDGTDVPAGSTITDNYDGTATFVWPTRPEDVGDHVLRVAAFDEGGGEMFQDVTISIVPRLSSACAGDCSGDGDVTVADILTCVNIALGNAPPAACAACDQDEDGKVNVNELLAAVNSALSGCPASGKILAP